MRLAPVGASDLSIPTPDPPALHTPAERLLDFRTRPQIGSRRLNRCYGGSSARMHRSDARAPER